MVKTKENGIERRKGPKEKRTVEREKRERKKKKKKRNAKEFEKDIFSNVARKICSHVRIQWKKSLTWMIAADQLVGREVSFSKSGFQFPKGAYRVPTGGNSRPPIFPPQKFLTKRTLWKF